MVDIIKTWPAFMEPEKVKRIFTAKWAVGEYYFTIGRNRPRQEIKRIWFTHRGVILGSFIIDRLVQNVGQLPRLNRLDGKPSAWQIKHDNWVAICKPPYTPLRERLYHESFRGWHYFNLKQYRQDPLSKLNMEETA